MSTVMRYSPAGAWENLDDTLHNGFIALSQRNIDGSTANRELLQSYSGADAQVYGWFDTHWGRAGKSEPLRISRQHQRSGF
jgi:hypothetical protein